MELEKTARGLCRRIWEMPSSIAKRTNPVPDGFKFVDTKEKRYFVRSLTKSGIRGAAYGAMAGMLIGAGTKQVADFYGMSVNDNMLLNSALNISGHFSLYFGIINAGCNALLVKTLEINKILSPFSYQELKSKHLKDLEET